MISERALDPTRLDPGAIKRSIHKAERHDRRRSLALVLPLVAFLAVTYVFPIGMILRNAVYDPTIAEILPDTAEAIGRWSGEGLPDDELFEIVARELVEARDTQQLGPVSRELNTEISGARTIVSKTARQLARGYEPEGRQTLVAIDPRWAEPEIWLALKKTAPRFTARYLLASVDLESGPDGIRSKPADLTVFRAILIRSLEISAIVTIACLLIGFPVAHMIVGAPRRLRPYMLLLVLVPFWTSLLVRTSAWIVLLQSNGVINDGLVSVGLLSEPAQLIFNRVGVYVAMIHILLPFMILPIYSVMLRIPKAYFQAALSLGAHPFKAFVRVYIPQTMPGVAAGVLIVFVLALGYYITPALVGGADDQMISYFIAFYTNQTLNWGLAASLAAILLATVIAIVAVLQRFLAGRQLGLG